MCIRDRVNSSLFVNYDWFRSSGGETKAEKSLQYAADNGIDPFAEVFFGVEANQGKFSGSHGSALHLDLSLIHICTQKNRQSRRQKIIL